MSSRPRSIWEYNRNYDLLAGLVKNADAKLLSQLQSIEAAKKRTPPIPLAHLLRLCHLLKKRPPVDKVDADTFSTYLSRLLGYGIRVPTAICMVSVVSKGRYPPMDTRVTDGLLRRNLITGQQAKALRSNDPGVFSEVYVGVVLPEWRKLIRQGIKPSAIDRQWSA